VSVAGTGTKETPIFRDRPELKHRQYEVAGQRKNELAM